MMDGAGAGFPPQDFVLDLTTLSRHCVYVPETRGAVKHAADELSRYLAEILSTSRPPIVLDPSLPNHSLILTSAGVTDAFVDAAARALRGCPREGYTIVIETSGIVISAPERRGVLHGVYDVLYQLGCRWLVPGPDGEFVPRRASISLTPTTRTSAPTFARRGFGEDTRAVPPDDSHWAADLIADSRLFIDWMAKNRLNHFTTRPDAIEAIRPEMEQRGMLSLHGGGHNIPRLLPRVLFDEHPEYFRMDHSGKRQPDGNLCVSNREAVEILVNNAVAEVRRTPNMEMFGVQGEDTWSGGWCACESCSRLSPASQNLVLCRAVAERLRAEGLTDTRVAFAAYRDTLRPLVEPSEIPPGLFVRYAPRERSYGAPLDCQESERNRWYATNLEKWRSLLDSGSLGVTEYYTDCVLFSSFPVPLMSVIAADLRYYARIGAIAWIRVLFMSRYCWWAYPLNFYTVARLSWDVNESVEDITADFCHHRFAGVAPIMGSFFRRFEHAMSYVVTYGDIYGPPQSFDPLMEKLMADLDEAQRLLREACDIVELALRQSATDTVRRRVRREQLAVMFAANEVEALAHQVKGQYWYARASRDEPRFVFESEFRRGYAKAAEELERAIALYRRGTELIRQHPEAPHSAWLDSGLGLHQRKEHILQQLDQKARKCRHLANHGGAHGGEMSDAPSRRWAG